VEGKGEEGAREKVRCSVRVTTVGEFSGKKLQSKSEFRLQDKRQGIYKTIDKADK
jgi:hypothetical protein